jgi:spore germination protein GerM
MLKDNMLVTVDRRLPAEPTIDDLIHELLAGPTHDERNIDITSALLGTSIITGVQVKGTVATVELAANLNETGRTDEILAIAQIVCTLTARPYISGANFTRDGHRIGVPRADGSLSQGPLTIADYASLLADS